MNSERGEGGEGGLTAGCSVVSPVVLNSERGEGGGGRGGWTGRVFSGVTCSVQTPVGLPPSLAPIEFSRRIVLNEHTGLADR